VTLTAKQRRVTLVRGRAYFDVAHDRSRPFAVNSAGTVTTALGTRFEVDVQRGGVRVTLAQGSIAVAPNATQSGWRELLRPGEQLRIPAGSGERERLTLNADRQVAWSQGRLEFDGTPLREALEIFNRYAAVKVLLGDEDLADTLIGGSFSAGADSESFVRALSAVLPMHGVRAGGDEIVLFHGRRTDGA
jgi:transmembrane sensor